MAPTRGMNSCWAALVGLLPHCLARYHFAWPAALLSADADPRLVYARVQENDLEREFAIHRSEHDYALAGGWGGWAAMAGFQAGAWWL